MRMAVRIFFKEIRLVGLENMPKDKPIILAANHNSAFMDAVVVAVFIEPRIYFLTRSDVFNTPLKNWILKKMNLIPIYRLQEGAENLHKNEETFADCNRILSQHQSILIFSEGICIQEKRLQKLKKGTARIAFGAALYADHKIDLQVVPVGINYNAPSRFRSNLLLNFAAPIAINDYKDLLKQDNNKAVLAFTRNLESAMAQTIVNLNDKSIDSVYDQVAAIYGGELRKQMNWQEDKALYFRSLREMGEALNEIKLEDAAGFDALKSKTNSYFEALKKEDLQDKAIKRLFGLSQGNLMLRSFLAILLMPVHLLSLVVNYWPYKMAYSIAIKKCKHIEFVASVMIGIAAFMYLFLFLVGGIFISFFMQGFLLKLMAFLILPLSAYFNFKFYSFLLNLTYDRKVSKKSKIATELLLQRNQLIELYHEQLLTKIKSRNN